MGSVKRAYMRAGKLNRPWTEREDRLLARLIDQETKRPEAFTRRGDFEAFCRRASERLKGRSYKQVRSHLQYAGDRL